MRVGNGGRTERIAEIYQRVAETMVAPGALAAIAASSLAQEPDHQKAAVAISEHIVPDRQARVRAAAFDRPVPRSRGWAVLCSIQTSSALMR